MGAEFSFLKDLAAPILGAGASTLFKGIANNYASDRDWSRNAAMNWQMWEANNEYNHPKNVMARYRSAGLNPNLIYGQMPQASQPAAVHSSTKPADVDINWFLANQLENSELTNDLTREEIKNKVQQQNINDATFAETLARTAWTKKKTELEDKYYEDRHAQTQAMLAEIAVKSRQLDLQSEQLKYSIERDRARDEFFDRFLSKIGLGGKPEEAPAKIEAIKVAGKTLWTVGKGVYSSYSQARKAYSAISSYKPFKYKPFKYKPFK